MQPGAGLSPSTTDIWVDQHQLFSMENNSLANECNWPRAWWALAIISVAALIYIYSRTQ